MLVMGFAGGLDRVQTAKFRVSHDSAAVLLRDGKVVAAFEEERLNRIKHTDKFPTNAIRRCLAVAGAQLRDLDLFALNFTEESALRDLVTKVVSGDRLSSLLDLDPAVDTNPRRLIQALLERDFGSSLQPERFRFVKHHIAHAFSAFNPSGFDRALVVTMDGQGNDESGSVATADERGLSVLRTTSVANSIGLFYTFLTHFLGFTYHDEFKVMGLAPYGDPAEYRSMFNEMYTLGDDGSYQIDNNRLIPFVQSIGPRAADEPFGQKYKNVAASLQEAVERIVFHVLRHYQVSTGMRHLCLAGGVAHNCTLNGKILASGLFSRVYVQPASHDAGCALGAAFHANCEGVPGPASRRVDVMPHLFLGTDIGNDDDVESQLARWDALLTIRRSIDPARDAAALLADANVIGWIQGRAEFGPRALGNRSILADPRPSENKEIINEMVKKREGFRPFAPAVLAERAAEFFDVPCDGADLGHMTYVLSVREDKRSLLGAVTHVDGSARVQTVSRTVNERFWRVIDAFGALTGVPVLLNTSFNNNAEPIVDSVDDAVVSYLTTSLNCLVVGNFIVEKKGLTYEACRTLVPSLCKHTSLVRTTGMLESGLFGESAYIANTHDARQVGVSSAMCQFLTAINGDDALELIVRQKQLDGEALFPELVDLWSKRLLAVFPK